MHSVISGEEHAHDEIHQYRGRSNAVDAARLLIEHGADIEAKIYLRGMRPLYVVAQHNYLDIARLLIEHGADVEAKDNTGTSALHNAVEHGASDVARLLIENGADIKAKNESGKTPLKIAKSLKRWPQYRPELVEYLENQDDDGSSGGIVRSLWSRFS